MSTLHQIICCKAIPREISHEVANPIIEQMLITEYYDGPISGFLQCSACESVYHFVTLDWSQSHFVRVIALSLVPADSMARILSFFAEVPAKPQWTPQILQRATEQDLGRIEAFLSEILAGAEPPSIVMAWNILTNEILSARTVGTLSSDHFVSMFDMDTQTPHEAHDWFAHLGVARAGQEELKSSPAAPPHRPVSEQRTSP